MAGPLVVSIGPDQNLFHSQVSKCHVIAHSAVVRQQTRERFAAWQSAATDDEGGVDGVPLLVRDTNNRARRLGRPVTSAFVMRVGPFQDESMSEWWHGHVVADTAMNGKQSRQRRAAA
jgi:hypothetical protein